MKDKTSLRWFGLVFISLAVALITVDSTIVNVAVPAVVDELRLSSTEVQWVQEAYTDGTRLAAFTAAGFLVVDLVATIPLGRSRREEESAGECASTTGGAGAGASTTGLATAQPKHTGMPRPAFVSKTNELG